MTAARARRLAYGVFTFALAAALCACSVLPAAPPQPVIFDLGLAPAPATSAELPAVLQVHAPPWLDGTALSYRLEYADGARLAAYRDSRWAAPPAALLQERLRQSQARATGRPRAAVLRVQLEEFCQAFSAPERSRAVVRLRAALLEPETGRLLAQQAFAEERDATTADGAGGAHALSAAADAALTRVLQWAAEQH